MNVKRRKIMMRRFLMLLMMTAIAIMVVSVSSKAPLAKETSEQHEVLSPWAEADPVPLRGLSPRLDTLSGKKIGLFANFKRAAVPITTAIEKRLKEKYPNIQTSLFHSTLPNVTETETVNREKFIAWIKSVDAVVGAVAD
jgi:hypothetical protein